MEPDIKGRTANMKDEQKTTNRLSPQAAKLIIIVILTVSLFFLAHSMVRHHFFSGGSLNSQHDITRPRN